MNLSQKIAAALANAQTTAGPIAVDNGTHRLTLDTVVATTVAAELNALQFEPIAAPRPDRTVDELKDWADRLVARVTYLMEPLVVFEVDAQGVQVEIRSQSPTPRAGLRSYFEVRLNRAAELRLLRLAYEDATRTRRQVPYQLTREVLERLADDLVATAP